MTSFGSGMVDGVDHDVVNVGVGDRIHDLTTVSFAADEVCAPQHPEVLRDHWLGCPGRFDEFVNTARFADKRCEQRESQRVGHCLEERGSLDKCAIGVGG